MALTRSIRQAIGTVWRGIVSSVFKGRDIYSTTEAVNREFQVQGIPEAQISPQTANDFASFAGQWKSVSNLINLSSPDSAVTSLMTAGAPWQKPQAEQNTTPTWHIIVGVTVEGQAKPVYRTITGITSLPATVGELRNLAYVNAVAMSAATTAQGGVGGTVTGIHEIIPTVGPSGG